MLVIVDLQRAGLEFAGGCYRLVCKTRAGVTNGRADAGKQLAGAEGLGDIVVRAEIESLHLVPLVGARRHDHDGQERPLADGLYYLEPVDVGKTEVEHYKIGAMGGYHGIRFRS